MNETEKDKRDQLLLFPVWKPEKEDYNKVKKIIESNFPNAKMKDYSEI